MTTSKTLFALVALSLSITAFGCASESADSVEKTPEVERAGQSHAELQAQISAFTKAVVERDTQVLSAMVSSEIQTRLVERGMDLAAFAEKERSSLARTFELADGELPAIEASEIVPAGDAVRVTLRFRGEELKKPFYFVREGGALKVNIAPPGFSKAAPDGALFGRSTYQVRNTNAYSAGYARMSCYNGAVDATVTVTPQSTRSVTCTDNCGFWSGTQFKLGIGRVKSCDWNNWGDDVVVNAFSVDGWYCNDGC